jgi:DNA-binding transcriptional MerR regulator
MENQHRRIKGYRELSADQIELINEIKAQGNDLGIALDTIGQDLDIDQRSLSLARTHLQQGFMWLIRAITRPEGFC